MKQKRFLKAFIFSLLFCTANVHAGSDSEVCQKIKLKIQSGDIVYLGLDSFLFNYVAEATHSWVNHVGIAYQDSKQNWYVYESKIPFSKKSSLCEFVGRALPGQVAIKRLENLSPDELAKIKIAAQSRLGIFYHLGFNYDSWRQFCSKFVYDVFREALAQTRPEISVGEVETLGSVMEKAKLSLNQDDFQRLHQFWQLWYSPLGGIPLSRRTVTPDSVFQDPDLVAVEF